MNLSGKWKIKTSFNGETGKVSYRTTITQKSMNGETEFMSVFLNLVKDAKNKTIENDTYIVVKPEDAWLSFYKRENGETQIVAMVKDFDYDGVEPVDYTDDLPF